MHSSDRWPAILLQLHREGWHRATDLAAAVGVSQRTIYRDMDALKDAGVPIRAVPGQGYTLDEDFLTDPIAWTTDEAAMLLLGSTYAAQHLGGRYRAAAKTAQRRLKATLPDDVIERVGTLRSGLRLVPEETFGGAANEQMLARLRQALLEERVIQFDEQRPDRPPKACTMRPYGLMRQGGTWHLVGLATDAQQVRSVRLDRIQSLTLRDETFERPDGYRTPLDSALPHQTVRVLFAPEVASSVQAAPSVEVESTERRPDGRLLMTLRVTREQDIVPWLLSWGAQAHVLEPDVLRRRLAREARQIAQQYQESPTLIE
jgi:predicted DNA-binding transcriptional regulator YafY